ncbi:MAG TPA: 50S ribosomal protein L10, partial [Solirubrobacteraceae bacterium]|nr:50S ribosomal protein L10 [Solirubrobacteraceae bacterium]
MNRDQKSAVIDEIAASISESSAIFAIDYRGISVEQARELRTRLRDADATLRVVKNSLSERAADKAGTEQLKALLQGPTALTFVRGDGALAAKAIADFARVTQLLAFKGGLMDGAALSPGEITTISRLPSRDVLYGQLAGLVANPITGLARTLNALIAGLAVGLGGILGQREAAGEKVEAPAEATAADAPTGSEAPAAPEAGAQAQTEEAATPSAPAEESPNEEAQQSSAPESSSEAAEEPGSQADAPETDDSPQS